MTAGRIGLTLLAALAWTATAEAREVTDEDRATVAALVEQVDTATEQGDFVAVMDVVPPAILTRMGEASGLSTDELRDAMRAGMEEVMAEVEIVSANMDLGSAETGETSSGRPYLVIPTETVMETGGQQVRSETNTLALEEGGQWYLARVDDETQIRILQDVFPDFAGVEFPEGSMSVVE